MANDAFDPLRGLVEVGAMTIFAVLLPSPQPKIVARIKETFPSDHLSLNDTQWLISTAGTVIDLTAKLEIYDRNRPELEVTGNAVIFATSSYFGRGPNNVWDWIKDKLEGPKSG